MGDDYYQEPESDGSLEYWMWCEEQMEIERQSASGVAKHS